MMTYVEVRNQVLRAVKYLASRCDGAKAQDGQGFRGTDTVFGHSLARQDSLSYNQCQTGLKMLQTYRGQLARGGIDLPSMADLPTQADPPLPAQWQSAQRPVYPKEITPSSLSNQPGYASPAYTRPIPAGLISLHNGLVFIKFGSFPSEDDRSFVKSCGKYRFDGATKEWSVPADFLDRIIARFPKIPLDPKLAESRRAMEEEANAKKSAHEQEITALLTAAGDLTKMQANGQTLFPHQQEGVAQMLTEHKMILGWDMGLGKTTAALVVAKAWQTVYPALPIFVVCPASLMGMWHREAEQMRVALEVWSWAKMPEPLEDREYLLIADEAHYAAAGNKSLRGEAFLALSTHPRCRASYPMTGTPIKNGRPINLLPLLQAIDHPLSHDVKRYHVRWCAAKETRWSKWDVTGAAFLDELHLKTKDRLARKTKSECLDLPPKIRAFVPAELSDYAIKQYQDAFKEMQREYQERVRKGEISVEGEALVMTTHYRHASSIAKSEFIAEMAREILDAGYPVGIFTEFHTSQEMIITSLRTTHPQMQIEHLTGETPKEDRQAMVDRFQAGQSQVFVSSSRAGGVGITLTKSSRVILGDRPWTPGDTFQVEDRFYRIGQEQTVNVWWVQLPGGIDEKIDQVIIAKQRNIDIVLEGGKPDLEIEKASIQDIVYEMLMQQMAKKKGGKKKVKKEDQVGQLQELAASEEGIEQ